MKPGKLQKSKQRSQGLCWKVYNLVKVFVLGSDTMPVSYYWFVACTEVSNYCALCLVKAKISEQKIILTSFITISF